MHLRVILILLLCYISWPSSAIADRASRCPFHLTHLEQVESLPAELDREGHLKEMRREDTASFRALRDLFTPLLTQLSEKATHVTQIEVSGLVDQIKRETHLKEHDDFANAWSPPKENLSFDHLGFDEKYLNQLVRIRGLNTNALKLKDAVFGEYKESFQEKPLDFSYFVPAEATFDQTIFGNDTFMEGVYATLSPVGEYGPEFTRKCMLTSHILYRLAIDSLKTESPSLFQNNRELLESHTQRAKWPTEPQELGPLFTVLEGILSMHQAVHFLLAQKIATIENPDRALEKILSLSETKDPKSIMVDFVQRLPVGVIGPVTLTGRSFPQPLQITNDKLSLSVPLTQTLANLKRLQAKRRATKWTSGENGIGCPVSFCADKHDNDSGIQALADGYLHIFKMVP